MDAEDDALPDISTILLDAEDEGFSGGHDDDGSSTKSLDADSKLVIQENARRYSNRPGIPVPFLPMDSYEMNRHDFVEGFDLALLEYVYHKPLLCLSPVTQLHHALDLVTGTGIWAMLLANKILHSYLEEINCNFEIDDINEDWTFEEDHFCLVRANNSTFDVRDYKHLCKEAFRVVKRGGYFELSGMDFEVYTTSVLTKTPLQEFIERMVEAGIKVGLDLKAPSKYGQLLKEAGFTNIQEKEILVPFHTELEEEREIAKDNCFVICEGIETLSLRLFGAAWDQSAEETRKQVYAVQSSLDQPAVLQHWVRHIVWGQKPM